MKLPISLAEKLLLLVSGERIAASKMKHPIIADLISEGIIYRPGKINSTLQLVNKPQLLLYLNNRFSIHSLENYIETFKKEETTRAELIAIASNSKLKYVRTFKGFLVNSFIPISATLNGKSFTINPVPGAFQFIYDFEKFIPEKEVTILGIENPENFRYIEKQQYLFQNIKPLFVSRYPQNQSKDLIKWLQSVPNKYLHFGDFDFAGIGIYLNEFKKYLGNQAEFFIPENIEGFIKNFGNKKCYDIQKINFNMRDIDEEKLLELIEVIHVNKKGLEQEVLCKKV
jgi:hypothetical protein